MSNEDLDKTIRRALAREADSVEPSADGLHEIQRKLRESRPTQRRPWLLTTGAAVLGTAAAVGLFAVLDKEQTPQSGPIAGQPTATPTQAPTPTASPVTPPATPAPSKTAVAAAVPVYWMAEPVGRSGMAPRLYRTFVRVSGGSAEEAVRVLADGRPDDPDYTSAWTGARVISVSRASQTITVDFAELPRKPLGSEAARIAAQALVHTVQGTLKSRDPVRITLDGGPAGSLFGHVDTSRPLRRSAPIDVQASIWILTPTNGASVTSPLTVTGIASVFEANVNWQVTNIPSGTVATRGFATASAGGPEFGDFGFGLKLPKGRYLLECFESSPEDGRPTFTDSKTITVR